MLKLTNVSVNYGKVEALRNVTLEVPPGKIVSLLGANGAGKTTTLRAISRVVDLAEGEITYEGQSLNKKGPHDVVKERIIHCPENRQVFPALTVLENLRIGTYVRKDRAKIKQDMEKVLTIFPRLKERLSQMAGTLSGGEQQMLAIGRALMGNPKVLLLDEPSLGLAPIIIREIFNIIQEINRDGTSILLVEQNANMALQIAHYAYVLENGTVAMSGKADELRNNPQVKELYLGVAH